MVFSLLPFDLLFNQSHLPVNIHSFKGIISPTLLLVVMGIALSCKKKKETTKPEVLTITESVYASGVVKSKNQYQVFSTVNGILHKVYVKEGDSVSVGDPLFQIQNATQRLSTQNAAIVAYYASITANQQKIDELKANIELSLAKYLNDSILYQRQQKLWKEGIGTKIELEQKELAYRNAKTALQLAQLRLSDVKKQLELAAQQSRLNLEINRQIESDYTIRSEVNGRVYSIQKKRGELIAPNQVLAIVGAANQFVMELQVDEYDVVKIHEGQKIFVHLYSYKGETFTGKVIRVDPIMNERTKTFLVEAIFETPPKLLYPNLTVEANILLQTRENVLTIPRSYLIGDTTVIMADESIRKVEVGLKDFQKAEIRSGLSANDEIIRP